MNTNDTNGPDAEWFSGLSPPICDPSERLSAPAQRSAPARRG